MLRSTGSAGSLRTQICGWQRITVAVFLVATGLLSMQLPPRGTPSAFARQQQPANSDSPQAAATPSGQISQAVARGTGQPPAGYPTVPKPAPKGPAQGATGNTVTSSQGDSLSVSGVVVAGVSSGPYENCYQPALTYPGPEITFCASIVLYDSVTGYTVPTSNVQSDTVYDACGTIVGQGSSWGWHIIGTNYFESGEIDSIPIVLPKTGVCWGQWSVGFTFQETFTDGVTLQDTSTAVFTAYPNQAALVLAQHPQLPLTGGPVTASEDPNSNLCVSCALARLAEHVAGEPVNTAYGNLTENALDLAIPGRGIPLEFARAYNSMNAGVLGPLGYGWTSNLTMSLYCSVVNTVPTAAVTQEAGATVVFTSKGAACTSSGATWTAAPRVIATLVYNSGSSTWTLVRHATDTFTFSSSGQLTQETDRNGYTTSLTYSGGNLSTVTDSSGRSLSIGWTGATITSVTDGNASPARVVTFHYNDGAGDLTDVIDVNGTRTHYVYDSNHRLTHLYDPNCYAAGTACNSGNGVVNDYKPSGQVDWQQDQMGRKTTFVYTGDPSSSGGGTTTITDPKGNITLDTYQYGLLESETKGYGTLQASTWQYRHDATTGAATVVADPDGWATVYSFDTNGNQLTSVGPLGRLTGASYNAFNEPLTHTDGNGITTSYGYDGNGNLTSVSRPLLGGTGATQSTQITRYIYGDSTHPGDVTAMIDPDVKTIKYTYNAYGDRTSVTDPLGNQTTSTYNLTGWLLTKVLPKGNVPGCNCAATYTTKYSYVIPGTTSTDQFGDVQTITDPLGHVTTSGYDADRNMTSVKDANGNLTNYVFDAANELTQVKRADGTTATTEYNPDGSILDQKDGKGNAIQTYGYDSLARVITARDALGNTTTYSYDGAGNQLTKQDPGGNCSASPQTGCTTSTYDAANQLTSVSYSDGITPNVTNIAYDADGQRTSLTDGTGNWVWNYDSLHRLTSVTDGNNGTVNYGYTYGSGPTYDLKEQVRSITYPNSVGTVTQSWDDAGRLTSVMDWNSKSTTFGYDANSNLITTTLPTGTGVVDTTAYNAADQLTSINDTKGTNAFFSAAYGRDTNGQLTSDTSANTNQGSYRYTPLNQVCYAGSTTTSACSTPPIGSEPFSYDAADNLVKLGSNTQAFNGADELCWTLNQSSSSTCSNPATGATAYTYDTRDNRVTFGSTKQTLTYDQANRLAKYVNGSTTATYRYNAGGLRMTRTVGRVTTQEVWDVSGALPLLLVDGMTSYVYGPGALPLEQISGSTALWYHHDQIGSTRAITDSTGKLRAGYSYDPYGNVTAPSGKLVNPFRFSGQYQDSESGLYYLRARYYDPTTAQFLTLDPAVGVTLSPYAYVAANPLNFSDPTGKCLGWIWGAKDCHFDPGQIFHDPVGALQEVSDTSSAGASITGGLATGCAYLDLGPACFLPESASLEFGLIAAASDTVLAANNHGSLGVAVLDWLGLGSGIHGSKLLGRGGGDPLTSAFSWACSTAAWAISWSDRHARQHS
jgi:RHS repeat-associated protein